jgi:NAD(P)-dependent dehydrogenase (short-subunit alcohol dehydrogenase family)
LRLAADGFAMALVDLNEEGLAETESRIAAQGGEGASFPFDVRDGERFSNVIDGVTAWKHHPDVLINNAGIGVAATILDTSTDDWDRTLDVNLTAMFHTCKAVLPGMLATGDGRIVNVSSIAGVVGLRNRLAYCASKAGVIGLTRALAADFADQGLRVNAICPGTVETEWIGKILTNAEDPVATRKAMEQRQLDGRMGSPEEVAAGIAFLVSDEARFVNGSAFMMDGGVTAV